MKRKRKQPSLIHKFLKESILWVSSGVRNLLVIAVILLGLMQYTGFKFDKSEAKRIDASTPLLANEDARLLIDTMRQLIAVQSKGQETKVYTGVRKATATKLDTGEIKLDIPTKGFTLEPGLVLGAGESLRVGADIQYCYWKRWGLTVGGTVPVHTRRLDLFRGHLGVAWSPYLRYTPNTSLWGGFDTNKSPIIGIRSRF